jgi:hypothetical protein
VNGHLHTLSVSLRRKRTSTQVSYRFKTVFCFQDGVLMYGEGACCDLPTVLQNWFCDPLEPLEATDIPRCVMIVFTLYCFQMCIFHINPLKTKHICFI